MLVYKKTNKGIAVALSFTGFDNEMIASFQRFVDYMHDRWGIRRKYVTFASLVLFAASIVGFFWFDIYYNNTTGFTFDALLSLVVIVYWIKFANQEQTEDGVLPEEIYTKKNWRLIYSAWLVVNMIDMTYTTINHGQAKEVWSGVVWSCYLFAFLLCEYLLCTIENPRKRITKKVLALSGTTG